MEKETIKTELISRCEKISDSIKANLPKSKEMLAPIHDKLEEMKTIDEFSKTVTDELNKIIAEKNISFKGNEKQELIDYLKPTITKLVQRHITQ